MSALVCSISNEYYDLNEPRHQSNLGALLNISFDAVFDKDKIKNRRPDLWRYREAIPIDHDRNIVSVQEGFTPLLRINFDGKNALIKQEQLFSSGSYKDRGATVLMSKIKEIGITKVVQDSSGNAGCAIAMYAALANIECEIFVPEQTSEAKLAQMKLYGAKVNKVPGSREDTANAAAKAAESTYYASHCVNPFFFQGTKTFAYEVCEQLGWKAPDTVVLPVGNGTLLIGCYIGFSDLLQAGIISRMPKLIAVQSENCAPLFHAFRQHATQLTGDIQTTPTMAEGIAIARPVRAQQMLEIVKETEGDFISVNEEEIIASLRLCGQMGYYIEPTSAAAIAGLRKYLKYSGNETVVSLFSGHGLKSTEKLLKVVEH